MGRHAPRVLGRATVHVQKTAVSFKISQLTKGGLHWWDLMSRPTTIDPFSITGCLLDSLVREVVGWLWWEEKKKKRVKEKKDFVAKSLTQHAIPQGWGREGGRGENEGEGWVASCWEWRGRWEIGRVASCGKEREKQSKCLGTMAVCWSGGQSTFCMLDDNASLIGWIKGQDDTPRHPHLLSPVDAGRRSRMCTPYYRVHTYHLTGLWSESNARHTYT